MKKRTLLILAVLLSTMLACSLTGGAAPAEAPQEAPAANESEPMEEPAAEEPAPAAEANTEFPLPDDATNITDLGNGAVNFQTSLSIPDVATFYRMAFPNYTEREILTIAEEGSLNLVFDGHESGKSVIIQGFPLGDGNVNVSIRLEDA